MTTKVTKPLTCTGEEWERQRMKALVRDNFTCRAHEILGGEPCGETRLRRLHVHHIIERQHGGSHDLSNLLTVCVACHMKIHPHMRLDMSEGRRELGDDNGNGWYIAEL